MAGRGTTLGDDARAVAGSHFGLMRRGGQVVVDPSRRVTPRAQAALDELVEGGLVSFDVGPRGVTYTSLRDCSAHLRWLRRNPSLGRFPLVEPEQSQGLGLPDDGTAGENAAEAIAPGA